MYWVRKIASKKWNLCPQPSSKYESPSTCVAQMLIKREKKRYPWSNGAKRNTMKLQKSFVQNENEAKINWAPNGAAMYAIVNKEAKNKFGEYPGYRFTPGRWANCAIQLPECGTNRVATSNVIFLTISNSSNVMNAVNFADHHFYVTKQKDTEAQGTHPYNVLNPADPLIDFAKFFDGESLDQEDL